MTGTEFGSRRSVVWQSDLSLERESEAGTLETA